MKKICLYLTFLNFLISNAQTNSVVDWINSNAIVIEDANPDHKLMAFEKEVPTNFKEARIFGFGEATHNGSEFFNLKAKFFRYLVENQGVTIFIMEESYQAEKGINQWISGGDGDAATIANNFRQGIWRSQEVVDLLQWMRNYNTGKPAEKQVRFYGMDNQFGVTINTKLRTYVAKHNITIDENTLAVIDTCSAAELKAGGLKKGWTDNKLPKLKQIEQLLQEQKTRLVAADEAEYYDMMRALNYLQQFTLFVQNPKTEFRDLDMYNNILEIMHHEGINSKAFIWAHNEHINKKELYNNGIMSVGRRLKDQFKDSYYSVGFDFGKGIMKGYVFQKGKPVSALLRTLDKPYKNTFAETLMKAEPDIYFIDIPKADAPDATNFFNTKNKQLMIGGVGFDPKRSFFFKRKYTESYDGLIFIKNISPANYKLKG